MIALTADCARKFVLNFNDWFREPGDWDCALLQAACWNRDFRDEIRAGYTYPSIGFYREHPSPNLKGQVREAPWHKKHILQGTRAVGPLHEAIEVCFFTEAGPKCVMHPGIRLPEREHGEDFRWWTAAITIAESPTGDIPEFQICDDEVPSYPPDQLGAEQD